MARNPIERALGVWSAANYRNVMLPGLGVVTCGELCDAIAALKAENERLERERDKWEQHACTGDEVLARTRDRLSAAERALAERAGGVNEDALRALAQAYDREDSAQRGEPDPWNLDDPGDIGDSDTWVSERLACARVAAEAFLSALEPAAPEGRREAVRIGDAVLDWMVKFDLLDAGNEYYVSDVLAVLNDLTPSTRPAEQAVTEAKPVAFRVHDFHVARIPMKARGKFDEPTEYFYPASRENDARETARIMGATCTPLYAGKESE